MLYRLRYHLAFLTLVFGFCWVVLPFFRNGNQFYPLHDFDEDMNKLYSDLGSLSQKRGDFLKAIRSYETALKHRPDDSECVKKLDVCLKKIKKSLQI